MLYTCILLRSKAAKPLLSIRPNPSSCHISPVQGFTDVISNHRQENALYEHWGRDLEGEDYNDVTFTPLRFPANMKSANAAARHLTNEFPAPSGRVSSTVH